MRVIAGKFRSRTLKSLEGLGDSPHLRPAERDSVQRAGLGRHGRRMRLGRPVCGYRSGGHRGAEPWRNLGALCRIQQQRRQSAAPEPRRAGTGGRDVAERDAAEALRQWDKAGVQFDVCFLDPPYRLHGAYGEILRTIARGTSCSEGGIVVAEHEKRFDPGEGEGDLEALPPAETRRERAQLLSPQPAASRTTQASPKADRIRSRSIANFTSQNRRDEPARIASRSVPCAPGSARRRSSQIAARAGQTAAQPCGTPSGRTG